MAQPTTAIGFSPTTPAPSAGYQNVIPQTDSGTPLQRESFQVPSTGGAAVKTASYTATAADCGKILAFNSATAVTLTLPAAIPFAQWTVAVQNIGAGALTVSPASLNLDGASASLALSQASGVQIATDGSNYFTVRGVASGGGGGGGGGGVAYGTFASLPGTVPAAGSVYKCTDSPYEFISNGTAWMAFFEGNGVTLPPSSGWAWNNHSTSTASLAKGYLHLDLEPLTTGSDLWVHYANSAPAAPYKLAVRFRRLNWTGATPSGTYRSTYGGFGVSFMDGTGAFIAFYLLTQGTSGFGLIIEKWNSNTSYNSSYNTPIATPDGSGMYQYVVGKDFWFQLADDGTNLTWSFSADGQNWVQFDQRARTAFLTAGPTLIGLSGRTEDASAHCLVDVFGWTVSP